MHEMSNDFDDEDETEFPAFPVVFQQEIEEAQANAESLSPNSKELKGPFKLPEKEIRELMGLI